MAPSDQDVRAAILGDRRARDIVGPWLLNELRVHFANGHRDKDKLSDLLQSAMVVVWANESGKAPHDAAGLLTWAVGVTVTLGKATRRLAGRDRHRETMHVHMPEPQRPWSPDSMVDLMSVATYVEELTTPHRKALIARLHGHTPVRLADEQGVKPDTIRQRYGRAVDQIKQKFDRDAQEKADRVARGRRQDETPTKS